VGGPVGEYAGGRKIGLERVKDQEKRREQENHNVFPVPDAFPHLVRTLANR
jgi:hypothetical protein